MTKKEICICNQCIAIAKAPELNKVPVTCVVGTKCSECGRLNALRVLNDEQVAYLRECQQAEKVRKAESVARFQKAKAEKALQAEKEKAERAERRATKVTIRPISLG